MTRELRRFLLNSSRRGKLLIAGGLVITAVLVSVVWMQVRQFQMLNLANQYQDDYLQVSLSQLETEYLRMREQWQADRAQPGSDHAALQMRYEIFVSRVTLLDTARARLLLLNNAENQLALQRIQRFVQEADAVLSTPGGVDAASLPALWPEVEALNEPVRALVLEGAHHLATLATQRNAAVRETNRNTIALTVLLALAAFGFAMLALSQYRRLDLRRRALETVTAELREARHVAEAASEAKSSFLANMSHEIRTPLQGVLGMLALLADTPLERRQQDRLRTARESADHLLAILNDLLDLAKLEAGKLTMVPQAVDLQALLADLEALMRPLAAAKGLTLTVTRAADLPRWVELDPTRVRQILLNLCSNAIKFTARGAVAVGVDVAGSRLRLSVQDTGIGIDDTTRQQLFQRFGRGDESRARRHGGTGLGLAISRQLAHLMGGDITVESAPGAGSLFVLELPCLAVSHAPPAPAPVVPMPSIAPQRGLRVLVADDNAVNRDYTGEVLERLGHVVVYATQGAEAVSIVQAQPVDLVLMDLHMPEVDGLGATRAIRRLDGPAALVPVVALTADAFADTRATCLAAGMDDFVTKPVSPAELAALLARHGGESPAARAPQAALASGAVPLDSTTLIDARIVLDIYRLLSADKLESLGDRLVTEARESLGRMQEALARGDREALRRGAHSCKGMAAALGLKALADRAASLQHAAADAEGPALAAQLRELAALVAPSRHALRETLRELDALPGLAQGPRANAPGHSRAA
jgi:two-component system, sensor histidine kinase